MDISKFFERIHPLDTGEHMFFPKPDNQCYSADELRAIADELDKRSKPSGCSLKFVDQEPAVDGDL